MWTIDQFLTYFTVFKVFSATTEMAPSLPRPGDGSSSPRSWTSTSHAWSGRGPRSSLGDGAQLRCATPGLDLQGRSGQIPLESRNLELDSYVARKNCALELDFHVAHENCDNNVFVLYSWHSSYWHCRQTFRIQERTDFSECSPSLTELFAYHETLRLFASLCPKLLKFMIQKPPNWKTDLTQRIQTPAGKQVFEKNYNTHYQL